MRKQPKIITWNILRAGHEMLAAILTFIESLYGGVIILMLQECQNLGEDSPLPSWELFHVCGGFTALAVSSSLAPSIRGAPTHEERASGILLGDLAVISSYLPDSWKPLIEYEREIEK